MSRAGPGRRPGDPEITKRAILEAARRRFGEAGYERATIRSIADVAGVDPALVHHHFGTKQSLFAKAHELRIDPDELIEAIAAVDPASRGEAFARAYLALVAGEHSPALSLIRAAATNEHASHMLREFLDAALLEKADLVAVGDRPRLRVALAATHMVGLAFGRLIVGVPDLRTADIESLVAAIAPSIQRYLTDPELFR